MAVLAEEDPGDLPGALLCGGSRRFLWLEHCGGRSQLSGTSQLELARHRRMQPELSAIPGDL